tara:strand:- start:148 stop:342 length:195 start_codon:yes stop_codon:yes gene_type:complete
LNLDHLDFLVEDLQEVYFLLHLRLALEKLMLRVHLHRLILLLLLYLGLEEHSYFLHHHLLLLLY